MNSLASAEFREPYDDSQDELEFADEHTQLEKEFRNILWTPFTVDNNIIYIKVKFNDDATSITSSSPPSTMCYSILITDLVRVWHRSSDLDALEREKEQYNSQLEASPSRLLSLLKNFIMSQKSEAHYEFSVDNFSKELEFKFSTKISSYLFTWTFNCHPLGRNSTDPALAQALFLKDSIFTPLLILCKELSRQRDSLANQLTKSLPKFDDKVFTSTMLESSAFKELLRNPVLTLDSTSRQIYKKYTQSLDVKERSQSQDFGRSLSGGLSSLSRSLSIVQPSAPTQTQGVAESLKRSSESVLPHEPPSDDEAEYVESLAELQKREEIERKIQLAKEKQLKKAQIKQKKPKFV